MAGHTHAGEERAVADAGRAKDRAVAGHKIAGVVDFLELGLGHAGLEQIGALGGVAGPHAQLDVAAEGAKGGGGEHAFG